MKKIIFTLLLSISAVTAFAEQSLQEKLGVCQANEYVQLEMADGKKIILFKARIHRAKLMGTPVNWDKKKKKYIKGEGNSPAYYANRIKKVTAFDISKNPK